MKKILLASAAAAALLFMPLAASAQYSPVNPAVTAPYAATTHSTTSATDTTLAQPSVTTTTTEAVPAATTDMGPAAPTTTTTTTTTGPSVAQTATPSLTPAQTEAQQNAQAATPTYDTTSTAPAYGATAQGASPTHASDAQQIATNTSTQVRGDLISDAKALELAQDAGMEAVPTSAAAVCQPRSLDLAGGATHANRNTLEFAVDRASVCELQAIAIPARGASGFRQMLIQQGVDESKITVSVEGANDVEMTFAGVATSGGMYAALYNPVRTAENSTQNMSYAPQSGASASSDVAPQSAPVSNDDMDMSTPAETDPAAPTL